MFRLAKLLYPTLMAACYGVAESKEVLEQEVSCALLCGYLEVGYRTVETLILLLCGLV